MTTKHPWSEISYWYMRGINVWRIQRDRYVVLKPMNKAQVKKLDDSREQVRKSWEKLQATLKKSSTWKYDA